MGTKSFRFHSLYKSHTAKYENLKMMINVISQLQIFTIQLQLQLSSQLFTKGFNTAEPSKNPSKLNKPISQIPL